MSVMNMYRKFMGAMNFVEQEQARVARILYAVASATLVGLGVLLAYRILSGQFQGSVPLLVISTAMIVSIVLTHRGLVQWSSSLVLWSLLAFLSYQCFQNDGMHDTAVLAFPGMLVIAGLVLERRYFFVFAFASLLSILMLGFLEIHGLAPIRHDLNSASRDVVDAGVILALTAVMVCLLADDLIGSLKRARTIEKELREQTEHLTESRERYRILFEGANDAILILSNDRFIDCNARAVSMFGCSNRLEILNSSVSDFSPMHQADGRTSKEKGDDILRRARGGAPQSFYWKHARKDGTLFDAEVSLSCLEIGHEILVQALVRDITERVRIEDALRKLKGAVEQSPVSIVITDTAGTIEYVNPKFTELTGYTTAEAVGQNPRILKSGLLAAEEYIVLWNTITSGGVWKGELCNKKKNGELYWERAVISPITNDEGVITHFLAVKEDITLQKIADRELQESEELHRKLITTVPDFIIRTDLEGNILFVNETAFPSSTPLSQERILGRNLMSFIAEEERPRAAENGEKMLEGQLGPREYTLSLEDGVRLNCEVNGDVLRSSDGTPYGMVYVVRDVSERKRAEEKRAKLELQLFHAQKLESIGTLAAGIAHDFNNVLSIVMGNISLIGNNPSNDEKHARRIEAIERAADRGAQIVKQLLTYARKTTIVQRSVEINNIIKEMAGLIEATFPKSVELRLELGTDVPSINGDLTQLHQVLLNLCVNARDAMPMGGRLTIATEQITGALVHMKFPKASARQYVKITVTDTGTGMDEITRKRIFDPFFTTKDVGKGTGLGLAVVHGIIGNHNGFIEVDSRLGKGTEFALYVPALEQTPNIQKDPIVSFELAPGGTETILLVEDEALTRDVVAEMLTMKGYHVLTAGDGDEGLAVFEQHITNVALIIADAGLPKMDGEELCRRVKQSRPDLSLIVVSGFVDQEKLSTLKGIGVDEILEKPYKLEHLLIRMRSILDNRKAAA